MNPGFRAVRDIALIVSGAVVGQKSQTGFPQLFANFAFDSTCDADAIEGSVGSFDAVEAATVAFF